MEIAEIIILCINTIYHKRLFFGLNIGLLCIRPLPLHFYNSRFIFSLPFELNFGCSNAKNWTFVTINRVLLASFTLPHLDPKFDLSLGYDRPGSILMCHGSCCCEYFGIVELFPTFIYDSEMGVMAAQSAGKLFCNLKSLIFRSKTWLGGILPKTTPQKLWKRVTI